MRVTSLFIGKKERERERAEGEMLRGIRGIRLCERALRVSASGDCCIAGRRLLGTSSSGGSVDTSSEETNPFHDACERGDLEAVEMCIRKGADVNMGDPKRANTKPLHIASRGGSVDVVGMLLAKGADVNCRGAWELTPLMYASVFDQPEIVSLLLKEGADAGLVDVKGKTALDHAVGEKNMGVVAVLNKYRRTTTS